MSFPKKLFALDRAIFFIIAVIAILAMIFGCKDAGNRDTAADGGSEYAFAKTSPELASGAKNNTTPTQRPTSSEKRTISQEWKDYWYAGKAEITSYTLEQARYGEIRNGTAALIFVTEDFLPNAQVKADRQNDTNIPILKLNTTKNFNTGIYPYSVMSSTFYPVQEKAHAIKVSQSMQEWCGHVYAQLNNRKDYEVMSHSYFESEGDQQFSLPKVVLENELWTQLRIDPKELPVGDFEAIPDFSYARMKHIELKAYRATGNLSPDSYTIEYPLLERTITINFSSTFPHEIESWEERYKDGGKQLTTKATKIKTIKSAYWGKNSTADAPLRKELGL